MFGFSELDLENGSFHEHFIFMIPHGLAVAVTPGYNTLYVFCQHISVNSHVGESQETAIFACEHCVAVLS